MFELNGALLNIKDVGLFRIFSGVVDSVDGSGLGRSDGSSTSSSKLLTIKIE